MHLWDLNIYFIYFSFGFSLFNIHHLSVIAHNANVIIIQIGRIVKWSTCLSRNRQIDTHSMVDIIYPPGRSISYFWWQKEHSPGNSQFQSINQEWFCTSCASAVNPPLTVHSPHWWMRPGALLIADVTGARAGDFGEPGSWERGIILALFWDPYLHAEWRRPGGTNSW